MGARFGLLGDLEVRVDGHLIEVGHARQQYVLAVLLAEANRAVPVNQLADRVWGDHAPHRARETIYNYLSRLRRALAAVPEVGLLRRPGGYVLTVDRLAVDLHRFHQRVADARATDDGELTLALYEQALGLWRGEALAGLDTPWAAALRDALEQDRFAAELDATDLQLRRGQHGWLLNEIAARAEAHPLDERAAGQMILALYQSGRQAEALDHFTQLRRRLADDLGIDPGPALQRLHRDILIQAPALTWPAGPGVRAGPAGTSGEPAAQPPARAAAQPHQGGAEVFVGRDAAIGHLAHRLAKVRRGLGQTVLVAGEPGIGKTSLLRRFTQRAGVAAVWAACPEQVAAPPLWPWEQVLRAVRALSPDHAVPAGLSGLLDQGTLPADTPDTPETPDTPDLAGAAGAAGAALRLFESIGRYLSTAAAGRVLVVVVDDLHWTDRTSLQLLAYLSEFLATSSVLLVASYRPHELSAALADTLAVLSRGGSERIELGGLDDRETLALARAITGDDAVTPTAATALRARTGGNPFFLREMIRLLNHEPQPEHVNAARVPPPVREVVLRRVNRLPRTTVTLLSMAAVAGQEFDLAVVAEAVSFEVDAALEAIDLAVGAGLVVEDDRRLGWFGFAHALVAEALYETTGRWRRTRLHHRIGQITARSWAGHDDRVAEIARHWLLAAELSPATAAKAAAYAASAARVADARLAHEAAAESWKQALAAAGLATGIDRYPLLVGLAISLYRSGNPRHGTPVFIQAMEEALGHEESQEPDIVRLVTVAVAALCESNWYPVVGGGADDERLVDVLERALPLLTAPTHIAVLLAFLAAAHYYDDNPKRRIELSDQALSHARPAADNTSLARVLYLRALALFGPDYPDQCLAAVDDLLGLDGLPPPMVAAARVLNAWLLATVGRLPEAAGQLERVVQFGSQVAPTVRVHLGWARAGRLLLAGRWAEAEEISRATFALHSQMSFGIEQGIAARIRMIQRWEAAFLTGRCAGAVDELRAAAEAIQTPGLRTMLAVALVEAGRPAEARPILQSLEPGPKDYRWLYTACWCLLGAARVGDVEQVTRLRDQLLPYRHLACAVAVHVVSGSVAYFTGEGALALGDAGAALADLALAIEADEAMGAVPWLARAREALTRAEQLDARGRP